MSKKRRTAIPDFSSHKPQSKLSGAPPTRIAPPIAAPTPRAKPQATSSKSGRRGT